MANRAIFLDRDGVVTQDYQYTYRLDQMNIIPRSAEAIKLLNENKFKVIVVTNQSGIARGYYKENEMILFNQLMVKELQKNNAYLDAIYYCPHHPDAIIEKYRINCQCRKPNPGMLRTAEKEFKIDMNKSFLIGDKKIDIDSGKNAKCGATILVMTGYGRKELTNENINSDFIANDLFDAVKYILDIKEV